MIKLISKFSLLLTILTVLYLFISGNVFASSPFVIAGQLLAVALNIWSRLSFQKGQFSVHAEPKEGTLLNKGPYQFIRHPMYAAALLFIWSSIFGHLSFINVIIGLVATGVAVIRITVEERLLQSQYPDYLQYAKKTNRIIPFIF
ncbi:MAG TPA: isoprenylcysteine carboxylmethyltransferase family protein [Ignavibacteriaceae bacterium]|nr:isoprenylcysteine carboxylmethyltransferase family protein [Ignavibacteriaceae bacterium]